MSGFILQTARIYSDASGKVPGWRSAVGLYCKFNRCAVYIIESVIPAGRHLTFLPVLPRTNETALITAASLYPEHAIHLLRVTGGSSMMFSCISHRQTHFVSNCRLISASTTAFLASLQPSALPPATRAASDPIYPRFRKYCPAPSPRSPDWYPYPDRLQPHHCRRRHLLLPRAGRCAAPGLTASPATDGSPPKSCPGHCLPDNSVCLPVLSNTGKQFLHNSSPKPPGCWYLIGNPRPGHQAFSSTSPLSTSFLSTPRKSSPTLSPCFAVSSIFLNISRPATTTSLELPPLRRSVTVSPTVMEPDSICPVMTVPAR